MYTLDPCRCAEMIRASRSTVVLTGAGISTAAGIPDFRGPQGLYVTRRYDPELVFDIDHFQREPGCFYEFSRDFTHAVREIRPTFTHRFLAGLESRGLLDSIITQNIDILHQLAGSRTVVELHGSYRSATCQSCHTHLGERDYDWWCQAMQDSPCSPIALCPNCSGVIKPDIVFFGESVMGYSLAERMVENCQLLLVLGSSLNVSPASLLPRHTSAPTIVINKGRVMLPASPQRYFVEEDLDTYFHQVAEHLA